MKTIWAWIRTHRLEALLILGLVLVSALAHAWNMFGFPYYENDEATYVSRAWAFISTGQLDVYTYRYDHAPLGWMLIGLWQLATGGAHLFGSLLASGRILMLVLHIASTVLVYILARRFSGGSKVAASVAVLFFALSPIALYFQRRILLDNIMAFWLLLSLYFATQPIQRLKWYILSGLTFGIAVLTKLNAVFIAPAVLFIVWQRAHTKHRLHAVAYWLTITGIVVASFFIYALLKGELLAAPIGPDGHPTHVSVMETFALQLGRGEFAWPWEYQSSFQQNVRSWLLKDWALLSVGAAATIALTVMAWFQRKRYPYLLALALIIWFYAAFLMRGKIVIDLYVVPLIPFMSLAIGVLVGVVYNSRLLRSIVWRDAFLVALAFGLAGMFYALPHRHYSVDETSNQLAAVSWVRDHIPKDAIIATDNYMYPYLAQESGYHHVSYFFSTEYDPEIRKLYDNDWRNVEYLVLTHEIVKQIKTGTVPRMKQVLDHAVLVADYRKDISSYVDLPNYISTNGDWVQVYKVKSYNDIVLQDSWRSFKDEYIIDYGQVIDPQDNNVTTSKGQAQAMVRAVASDDQAMFDGLWQWSRDHLRYRAADQLLSSVWQRQADGSYALADSNANCDADQLVVQALYQADDAWPGDGYGKQAAAHLEDWWRQCTFVQNGHRYLKAAADANPAGQLLNSGYFRPAVYRYLAGKAPGYEWSQVIADGYGLAERLVGQFNTLPDWILLGADGSLVSAVPVIGASADQLGYEGLQLVPSLATDYALHAEPRALALLQRLQAPVVGLATQTTGVPATLSALLIQQVTATETAADRRAVQKAYEQAVDSPYRTGKGYWGDGTIYLDQIWFWQWHQIAPQLPKTGQVTLR